MLTRVIGYTSTNYLKVFGYYITLLAGKERIKKRNKKPRMTLFRFAQPLGTTCCFSIMFDFSFSVLKIMASNSE
jgi:hypothetical protein